MEKSEALPAKPNHKGYTLIQKILMALTLLLVIRFAWILILPEVPSLKESKDDMFFSTTAKFIFAGWPRSITSTLDYESRTALLQEKKTVYLDIERPSIFRAFKTIQDAGIAVLIVGVFWTLLTVGKLKENDKSTFTLPLIGSFIAFLGLAVGISVSELTIDNANDKTLTVLLDKNTFVMSPNKHASLFIISGRKHMAIKDDSNQILLHTFINLKGDKYVLNLLSANEYEETTIHYSK